MLAICFSNIDLLYTGNQQLMQIWSILGQCSESEFNSAEVNAYLVIQLIFTVYNREALWPSGRVSDSGVRGRGLIFTQVAMLYP